ncbi:MAG TPA: TolC family protein [Bacteroidia bacterium]|nr:TolC family protein [Bacteroidia bacterium]
MKRTRKHLLLITQLVLVSGLLKAQAFMGLDEAIKTGLEKNYGVLILKNQKEISRLQNNPGNAGMSPQVNLSGGAAFSNINSFQAFTNGTTQDRYNAKSTGYSSALSIDMMVYDGNKMFAIKKRLAENEQLADLQLRQQMENLIHDVILAYYDIVRIDVMIRTEKQNLLIYEERMKIAKLKLEVGSDSKVDYLLSQTDLNRARSVITQMELQLVDAKVKLNKTIGIEVDREYNTEDTIVVNYEPSLDELKKDLSKKNAMIMIARQNELVSAQLVRESKSALLPFVSAGLDYRFLNSQSQAGFLSSNNQNGFFADITAGWTLYNGSKNRNLLKERNINLLNQQLITKQTELEVDAQVQVNYRRFLLSKQIAKLEFQNLTDSKELQNISLERYRIGKTNLLEIIEAQKNLEDAQYRYITALYSVKQAEVELLKANGSLLK